MGTRRKKVPGFVNVTVHKVPGRMEKVTVETGSTVGDVLEVANYSLTGGWELRIGDEEVEANAEVSEGDHIMLMQKVKGA